MTSSQLTPGRTARGCILCDFGLVYHEVPVISSFLCGRKQSYSRVQSLLLHLSEWGSLWLFGQKNPEGVTRLCGAAAFSWFSYRGWSCPPLRCLMIQNPPCFKETQTGVHGVLCGATPVISSQGPNIWMNSSINSIFTHEIMTARCHKWESFQLRSNSPQKNRINNRRISKPLDFGSIYWQTESHLSANMSHFEICNHIYQRW